MQIKRIERYGPLAEALDAPPLIYHVSTDVVDCEMMNRSNAPCGRRYRGYPAVKGVSGQLVLGVADEDNIDFSGDTDIYLSHVAPAAHVEDGLDWIEGIRDTKAVRLDEGKALLDAWRQILETVREAPEHEPPSQEDLYKDNFSVWSHADPASRRREARREDAI